MALALTLFSNVVIFFFYDEQVWKVMMKDMMGKHILEKKIIFFQVFDVSLSPIFDENDKFPTIAIVAPYRLLFQDNIIIEFI